MIVVQDLDRLRQGLQAGVVIDHGGADTAVADQTGNTVQRDVPSIQAGDIGVANSWNSIFDFY